MAAQFLLRGVAAAAARSARGHRLSVPFGAFAGPGSPNIAPAAQGLHYAGLSSPFSSIPEVDKAVRNLERSSELDAPKAKRTRSAISKTRGEAMMFPLQFHYEDVLRQDLLLKLNHANVTQVPGLFEVRLVPKAASELKIPIGKLAMEIFSGQSLVETQKGPSTKAGKSNPFLAAEKDTASAFARQSILRGHGMYHFLVRFLTAASMLDSPVKIQENSIKISMEMEFCEFSPELEDHFEIFEHIRGFNVTVVTSASTKDETSLLWSGILQKDEGGN